MKNEELQRLRRIETRLTQLMVAMGVGTQAQKPDFEPHQVSRGGVLTVVSPHTSLREMLDAIPMRGERVEVQIGEEHIATITKR